jgi:hypothetical protein
LLPSKQQRRDEPRAVVAFAAGTTAPGFRDLSKLERPVVSTMSQTPSLLETIDAMLSRNKVPSIGGRWMDLKKEEDATPVDRAFLESWRNHVDDPIWSRTLSAVQTFLPYETYGWIVVKALRVNRLAEGARSGVDLDLEQRRKEHLELLEKADQAEALANYFSGLDAETAAWYDEFLHPTRELVKLRQKESSILRKRAGADPEPTVPMIRQDRRGGQSGLRVRHAFIHLIAEEFLCFISAKAAVGFNHVEAIVAFTRIRFPEADAEVVRKTLEPTTREGRRQRRAEVHNRNAAG